jgi:hypothetical protein
MYLPVFNQEGASPSELRFWNKCALPTIMNGVSMLYRFVFRNPEGPSARSRAVGYYIIEDTQDFPDGNFTSKNPLPANKRPTTRAFLASEIIGFLDLKTKEIIPNPFYDGHKNSLDKKQDQQDTSDNDEARDACLAGCLTV